MKRIGGNLDLNALAMLTRPELMHRPTDPTAIAREGKALLALGLSVVDAASALGVTAQALSGLLASDPEAGP